MIYSILLKQSLAWLNCRMSHPADAQLSFLLAVPRSNIAPYKMTILPQAVFWGVGVQHLNLPLGQLQ